uniref:Glutaredoxin domain-containing protein n=1 Tax=Trichuris muris TaxID=70415 RepID=A0A5S6QFN7_TRIMR
MPSASVVKILTSVTRSEEEDGHILAVTEVMNAIGLPYSIVNGIDQRFSLNEGFTIESLTHTRQGYFPLFFQNGAYLGNIMQFYTAYWEGNIRQFFPCLCQFDDDNILDDRESEFSNRGSDTTEIEYDNAISSASATCNDEDEEEYYSTEEEHYSTEEEYYSTDEEYY